MPLTALSNEETVGLQRLPVSGPGWLTVHHERANCMSGRDGADASGLTVRMTRELQLATTARLTVCNASRNLHQVDGTTAANFNTSMHRHKPGLRHCCPPRIP